MALYSDRPKSVIVTYIYQTQTDWLSTFNAANDKQYQATMQSNDATHQNMFTGTAVSIHEEYESNFEFRPKTMSV